MFEDNGLSANDLADLSRQYDRGRLDVENVEQVSDLLASGEIDQADAQNLIRLLIRSETINTDTLLRISENNGDLSETRRVESAKNSVPGLDSNIVWLEEGNDAVGFEHILLRHGTSDQFYAMSGVNDAGDIEDLVMKAVVEGQPEKTSNPKGTAFEYRRDTGKYVTVIVGDNGFIVTARPGEYE